ncbi:tyrosine-type recombinase/integrase [Zunongwangia sp. HRR-M8]|uniref:tyrosine-type recombinase/integrase n=1 Tax=Zunongwangia sp. HRR-M8 TaxID=3015170 RepID=UPI0022DD3C25|nr:phage integrase SAM-like domain-containing protein [Zunongwangia sp. HRR-M8]WBL22966.1 phage integrase SAM-like domain-containing protein [Zunongwangia sp. HRR-M8]
MATFKYIVKSKTYPAKVYLRLRHSNTLDIVKTTNILIDPTDWDSKNQKLKKKYKLSAKDQVEYSKTETTLAQLKEHIKNAFNQREIPLGQIDNSWLEYHIDIFNGDVIPEIERSDFLIDAIQHVIDTANIRENNQKGLGLSKSRVNSYNNLLKIIKKYQGKNIRYRIKEIDLKFGKAFLNWLINSQKYSEGYARKKIDDLKTVCRDAQLDGLETSLQLNKIKGGKTKKEHAIYLNPHELDKIENTHLVSEALVNARKWLILGANIGTRGQDLLNLTKDNFVNRSGLEVIEIKQQKTGKNVTIPILDKTREIIKDGLPKKISIQKLNTYFKKICELSEINEPTLGTKILMIDENGQEIPKDKNGKYIKKGIKRAVTGTYQKWELVTTHVCRRSFATNQYGILPTSLIMRITGHSTEKQLLEYVRKDSLDYAQQIADFYELQKLKQEKTPKMNIIKNVSKL